MLTVGGAWPPLLFDPRNCEKSTVRRLWYLYLCEPGSRVYTSSLPHAEWPAQAMQLVRAAGRWIHDRRIKLLLPFLSDFAFLRIRKQSEP
jgi:hypothetical protein